MEQQPKLSVIIPVYNASNFLRQGLDSILLQSLKDLEVICVDDESTDNSLEILREYAEKDPRVVVLEQKNSGAAIARNKGIDAARGEYIHFLDADDYVAEGAYEAMYQGAVAQDADMVKCKACGVDETTGQMVPSPKYNLINVSEADFNRVINFHLTPEVFTKHVAVVPWNGLYKTSFLREHNIRFQPLYCVNDRSFYSHVLLCAQRVVLLPVISVYHRMNLSTSLVGQRIKHFDCHFRSYRITEELCRNQPEWYQAIMLRAELNDTFVWFKRYRDNEEYGPGITERMRQFLSTIDTDFFERNGVDLPSRKVWLELIPKKKKESTPTKATEKPATPKAAEKAPAKKAAEASVSETPAVSAPAVSPAAHSVESNFYKEELMRVYQSKSYKIGRAITFFPRKLRGGIRCYKEHGLLYTLERIRDKFCALFRRKQARKK